MRIILLSLFVVFISCGSLKNTATDAEINTLKETVLQKNIEVTFNWARPLALNNGVTGLQNLLPPGSTVNNINLIGNPNFFRIKNDSIHMDLPYYGQQQMRGGYNSETGVKYKGPVKSAKKTFDEKKGIYILKYGLDAKNEFYNVTLTLFANTKKSTLTVNSSNRTSISYDGNWKVLIEKEE